MTAYKMPITKPKCVTCGQSARFEVFNTWNGSVGYHCGTHAETKLRQLRAGERAAGDGRADPRDGVVSGGVGDRDGGR